MLLHSCHTGLWGSGSGVIGHATTLLLTIITQQAYSAVCVMQDFLFHKSTDTMFSKCPHFKGRNIKSSSVQMIQRRNIGAGLREASSKQQQQLHHTLILWTSTPVGTWGTAVGPAASSAISRCSACGNSGNTDPRPAGSRPQALYLQTCLILRSTRYSGWCDAFSSLVKGF